MRKTILAFILILVVAGVAIYFTGQAWNDNKADSVSDKVTMEEI